jgi:hypothetical protein
LRRVSAIRYWKWKQIRHDVSQGAALAIRKEFPENQRNGFVNYNNTSFSISWLEHGFSCSRATTAGRSESPTPANLQKKQRTPGGARCESQNMLWTREKIN